MALPVATARREGSEKSTPTSSFLNRMATPRSLCCPRAGQPTWYLHDACRGSRDRASTRTSLCEGTVFTTKHSANLDLLRERRSKQRCPPTSSPRALALGGSRGPSSATLQGMSLLISSSV